MKKLLFLIIFLLGCNKLERGKIVDKQIESSYYSYYILTIPSQYYTFNTLIPIYYPEAYKVKVLGINGNDTIIEWFYVKYEKFDCLEIGDTFTYNTECEKQRKYEKVY